MEPTSPSIRTVPLAEAPITDVIVFSDDACRVTRQVEIQPTTTGVQGFIVEGLTRKVDADSVRVTGNGPCSVLEVNTEVVSRVRSEFAEADATKKEIEDLMEQLKELQKENEKLKHRQLISNEKKEAIQVFVRTQLSSVPKGGFAEFKLSESQSVLKLLDVYAEAGIKIDSELVGIAKSLDDVKLRYEVVDARLRELLGGCCPFNNDDLSNHVVMWQSFIESYRNVNVTNVKILIDVKKIEPLRLNVAYEVWGCNWNPSYDVRCSLATNQISLHYHAHITQRTEEDWTDVNLSVSTARRQRSKDVPKLPSEIVRFYEPPPPPAPMPVANFALAGRMGVASCIQPQALFMSEAAAPASMPLAKMAKAIVSSSGVTTSYQIEKRTTIEADGKAHKVGIAQLEFSANLMRYAVPSLSKSIFLQAHGTNDSEYQLMSSNEVSIFIDGAFVGKSALATSLAPGEKFHFSLGVDPNVTLTHIPARTYGKESGYVSKSRHRTYDVVTHLKSAGSSPITIVVVSQYPTSSDAKITLKLTEPSAPVGIDEENDSLGALTALEKSNGSESFYLNKTTNHLLHVVQLNPGATKTSGVRFEVEWPADKEITLS